MEISDSQLVSLANSGDAEAFGQLIERHYDLIFRNAFRVLGRRADAEDLAQDVCAALPGKLGAFRGEARFTTWLYRVVSNAAVDRLRKRLVRTKAAQSWGDLELMQRADNDSRRAELDWLARAMTTLPPDLRATVALTLGEDMTHAQAARALDISEGTVSWRMSEVRKNLRALAESEEKTA